MQWILGGLAATAIINGILALLVLGSTRQRRQKYSLALVLASAAVWAFGIMEFLRTDDIGQAYYSAVMYYIAAAVIAASMFYFGTVFPKKLHLPRWILWIVATLCIAVIAVVIAGDGLIEKITLSSTGNLAELSLTRYWMYVAYYVVIGVGATAELLFGLRLARKHRRGTLAVQMYVLVISMLLALGLGMWFNLFLPLLGEYHYIWAGPLLSLSFTVTLFWIVIRQGVFDIKQAVVRTVAFILLVGSLVLVAWGVSSLLDLFVQQHIFALSPLTSQVLMITILALCMPMFKLFLDRYVDRILYIGSYDSDVVLAELRQIAREQSDTNSIVKTSLGVLGSALDARYASAFILENNEWHHIQHGVKNSPHQIAMQQAIVENHADQLPMAGLVSGVDQLRESPVYRLLMRTAIPAYIRLESQKQTIGIVFFGPKQNGKTYDDKDLALLSAVAGDLSLAVENSLRFLEIEQFTTTLEQRITAATKELKKSNSELQKLDTTKDEFISMASHQLRTPLTSVKGYIDMVLEGDAGKITPMQKQLLSQAFESSERMVHLINDFLNVSRLQTGKFMLEQRQTDLAKLVKQEISGLESTAKSHGLRLAYRAPRNIPILYLDDNKIRQVVMNFIDNAIYYSRTSSTIEIKLFHDGGDIVFEVHDTGIGVPKSEQAGLFKKFFRATNARKQRPDGTGVGLFLAKKVIDEHKGQVIFHSTEGKGSVFGFRLPIVKLAQAEQAVNQ